MSERWEHLDGTLCVAGHHIDDMQCVEGGGPVRRRPGLDDELTKRMRELFGLGWPAEDVEDAAEVARQWADEQVAAITAERDAWRDSIAKLNPWTEDGVCAWCSLWWGGDDEPALNEHDSYCNWRKAQNPNG